MFLRRLKCRVVKSLSPRTKPLPATDFFHDGYSEGGKKWWKEEKGEDEGRDERKKEDRKIRRINDEFYEVQNKGWELEREGGKMDEKTNNKQKETERIRRKISVSKNRTKKSPPSPYHRHREPNTLAQSA